MLVQDLLVASLFRNFLLAERIMRAASCSPVSYPRLPPTHQHPMWQVSPQHCQHSTVVSAHHTCAFQDMRSSLH